MRAPWEGMLPSWAGLILGRASLVGMHLRDDGQKWINALDLDQRPGS